MLMNYHSDSWIMNNMQDHYVESLKYFNEDKIVGCFYQGSGNYGLDTLISDVDTKLIVTPSFKDICLNSKPISTTHIRENNEHTDWKDIRLYIETFRKQNLNFLEILFTKYFIVNPIYKFQWDRLVNNRELIAHMNTYRAVKSMYGVANEKYHAMSHPYPSKIEIIKKYGYDGKQVSHLLRVEDYLRRYIEGETYENCLIPSNNIVKRILDYKMQKIPYEEAKKEAALSIERVTNLMKKFCNNKKEEENLEAKELLLDVAYMIMKISVEGELNK